MNRQALNVQKKKFQTARATDTTVLRTACITARTGAGNYLFTDVMPREDEVAETLTWTPKILERKNVRARVYDRVRNVIETFINGMRGF
ncbi:hypothetical protein QM091_20090 [Enterobacter roggenkampii]|nr:hypothetical protein [Enterobacter roggenkampii]MBO4173419.1 hypothetical protein [Enterobacter roggenkampii]MDH1650776.1 hypothetical protein [Enterobacter roggenkampii]MDV5321123.1 hypothetical protein [Enterobacter roggenkampii]MDV5331074.1 hypothetical protein [Enterobacter roggenkampii]MDV5682061.1 hypothetical protein [Enterobacter roggenkampii]